MLYEVGFKYDDFSEGGWACIYKTLDYSKAKKIQKEMNEKAKAENRPGRHYDFRYEIKKFPLDSYLNY